MPSQWNVINYWAIWCKPCREEIPELNQLNQIENVVVLGVNFDGKVGEALVSDAGDLGIAFDIIDDPAASLNIARPSVLPTTLVLSPEARLSRRWWTADCGINHCEYRPNKRPQQQKTPAKKPAN